MNEQGSKNFAAAYSKVCPAGPSRPGRERARTSRTMAAAEKAGFRIDDVDRFTYPETQVPWPAATNVLVHASRTT
jgi:hypothetical protein